MTASTNDRRRCGNVGAAPRAAATGNGIGEGA